MCAVPNIAVFCSSLISCFPGMLLKYFLKDFELLLLLLLFNLWLQLEPKLRFHVCEDHILSQSIRMLSLIPHTAVSFSPLIAYQCCTVFNTRLTRNFIVLQFYGRVVSFTPTRHLRINWQHNQKNERSVNATGSLLILSYLTHFDALH
jgi:hypothetical protein